MKNDDSMNIRETLTNVKKQLQSLSDKTASEIFEEALFLGFDGNYSESLRVLDEAISASEGTESEEGKSLLWSFKAMALLKLHREDEAFSIEIT